MRYVIARLEDETREMAYRIYVTKSLQLAPQGKALTINYTDILKPAPEEEQKTGEEIAIDIIKRAGLIIGE